MKRVLFVDDEQNVLNGLRRMLRHMRHDWQMDFVLSGNDALQTMATKPYDVVVTDMRMPGMDGAQLLTEIANNYPDTIRIILSGHSGQEVILRSVGPAHQYLTKPCEADHLKTAIDRACGLCDVITDDDIKKIVGQLRCLPSLPSLYVKIVEELQSNKSSIARIAGIISQDIGMTAKILQLVNSAFFALPRRITNPADAVVLLGLDIIKALVLTVSIFAKFDQTAFPFFSMERLMVHSMEVGELTKVIAEAEQFDKEQAEDALLAGFLHDCGKLLLAANLSEEYAKIVHSAHEQGVPLSRAEFEFLGVTHAEVGASLLGIWGLPNPIVEAVAFQHRPGDCVAEIVSPLTVVHAANALVSELHQHETTEHNSQIDMAYIERLGVTERVAHWRDLSKIESKKQVDP